MGGAQPLAAVFAGACCLAVECDRNPRRLPPPHPLRGREDPFAGRGAGDDRALDARPVRPSPSALIGNAADVFPELVRRGVQPDIVTDQTSAARPDQRLPAQGLDRRGVAGQARDRRRRRSRRPPAPP
ncbi:MAG: hypothetical protein ACMVO3_20375 [Thalassobaculum sp.]